MSREIKFRAWVKSENCYMGKWSSTQNPTIFSAVNEVAEYYGDDDLVVEQYTGLKDKNGKEIYEGDILEFGIEGVRTIGFVGYSDDFASYETYSKNGYIIRGLFGSIGKVIGNIHENKELLEGEE